MDKNESRRVAILAAGLFTRTKSKMAIATGVLRYAPYPVVAVIDPERAGTDAAEHAGVGVGVPVVESLDEALARGANVLLIGDAYAATIPDTFRPFLVDALSRGLEVWNTLLHPLAADPELRAAAEKGHAHVIDLRQPPPNVDIPIGGHRFPRAGTTIVLTVGSDGSVGKMTTSIETAEALRRAGLNTTFVATSETAIAIVGGGISISGVPAHSIAGAAEMAVCDAAETADWVVVEGNGALTRPGVSAPTLGVIDGSKPDLMILCHDVSRMFHRGFEADELPIRPLSELVRIYEAAASWRLKPGAPLPRVAAIALNTRAFDDNAAADAIALAEKETGLPVIDPIRNGGDQLAEVLVAARAKTATSKSA